MRVTDLLIITIAIGVGSVIKGMTGAGLPQIAIPVLAIFLGVEHAVVVMAVPGVVSNAWLVWSYRAHLRETRDLPVLVATGLVGVFVGTWLLISLDPRILSGVIAVIILGYVVVRSTRPELELAPATTRLLSPPLGLAAGILQGGSGMSGPLLTTYLHSYRLPPAVYVVSLVTLFQVLGTTQAVALVGLGLLTPTRLIEGLLALIPMGIGLALGARQAQTMQGRTFDRWVLAVLVGTALKLAHSAIWG